MMLRLSERGIGGAAYRSPAVTVPWLPGEYRDVDDTLGAYLLGTFPGLFTPEVDIVKQEPVVALDRKVRAAPKRGSMKS